MNPSDEDEHLALLNPWKLTACQCMAMRLVCCYGSPLQAVAKEPIVLTTLKWHLNRARTRMGYEGYDIRMYLDWDWWVRNL